MVLDPCYKLEYMKFCYSKFYHSTKVDEIIGKVKHFMELFYQQYSSTLLDNTSNSVIESSQNSKDVDKGNANAVKIILNKNKEDWHNFLKNEKSVVIRSELDRYLEEGVENDVPNFDILDWWKGKASSYRVLSLMGHDNLSIPMSTVALESSFSTEGRVLDQFCNFLTPKIVECLICAQDWLRSSSNSIEIEEKIEMLEEIEIGKCFSELFFHHFFKILLCFDHII